MSTATVTQAPKYDITSGTFFDRDYYATFAAMRRDDRVWWHPELHAWILTGYDDVRVLCGDRRFSTDRVDMLFHGTSSAVAPEVAVVRRFFADWLIFYDAPKHPRYRRLMSRAFTPAVVEQLRPFITAVVERRLAAVAGLGRIDLMSEIAFPIPAEVIAHMLGVPETDFSNFKIWSDEAFMPMSVLGGDRDEVARIAHRGVSALEEYFRELIDIRREHPTDDMLSALVHAESDGTRLSEQELVSLSAMLLAAGHETTTNLIGNAIVALLRHPAERAKLEAQPELIGAAVEEFLRYDCSPIPISRVALEDSQIGGMDIKAGQLVIGIQPAANRDPAAFPDPDRLDFGRVNNLRHVGFGQGPHVCIGAPLARLELSIIIPAILRRLPNLALEAPEITWTKALTFHGPTRLMVSFDVTRD